MSSVYPRIPLKSLDKDASFIALHTSEYEVGFSRFTVKSTTETLAVGTRKAIPVNFPFIDGNTLPTALAAPVDDGMIF